LLVNLAYRAVKVTRTDILRQGKQGVASAGLHAGLEGLENKLIVNVLTELNNYAAESS
jgi:hypothetical protein